MRMKMKKLKILIMHQSTKVTDFDYLETEEMRDFDKMKTSAIVV
jgi:hypothetical protein